MPGKHAPDSPRSYYVSLARALGAALGAVALMVVAVIILLSRGGGSDQAGSPAITPRPSASTKGPSPRPTSSSSPRPAATSSTLAPSKVTVNVQNGTNKRGLAAATAAKIRDKGYQVTQVNNAGTAFSKSTVFYRAGAKDEALAFQESFPEFTVLKVATGSQTAMLRVVIGADYP